MIDLRRLIPWVLEAWPVLAFLLMVTSHRALLNYFPGHGETADRIVGALLQAVGGLLVLYSVNQNLGLFRRRGLFGSIAAWLRSFPVKRPVKVVSASASASASVSASATLIAGTAYSTLEQRVGAIERQLEDLRKKQSEEIATISRRIIEISGRFDEQGRKLSERISELGNQLEVSAVGGFKLQIFGVLVALYGAWISLGI